MQISVNGRVVLTTGHDKAENLTAYVEVLPRHRAVVLNAHATSSSEFLMWPTPAITPGDEVTIRLVDTDTPDRASIAELGKGSIDEKPSAGPICAFCGKAYYEVQTMLSGKRAFVCGGCVELLYSEYARS
ncbi:MAG TPA: ClpX C4-type zinc finger protein [Steroidobacter sp.]